MIILTPWPCPATAATTFEWRRTTPLAAPVVPEVYMIRAMSFGFASDSTENKEEK